MTNESYLNLHLKDLNEKSKIFANWFHFFWTLNAVALTLFASDIFKLEIAILFCILTFGAIFSCIIMILYFFKKKAIINDYNNKESANNPDLISSFEMFWGIAYTLSFVVLLVFWIFFITKL